MTKRDLADKVLEKLASCTSKEQAFELVQQTLEVLKNAIVSEGTVKISGFGKFVVREKSDRKGRNPQTGEPLVIASRKVLTFKSSQMLKEHINRK
jgi:integration host factor subunit alpha